MGFLTKEDEDILIDNVGPRERANGSVYYPEEYVNLIRKYAIVAREEYDTGEYDGRNGACEALFLAASIVKTLSDNLHKPLSDLCMAINELNNGQQLKILTPSDIVTYTDKLFTNALRHYCLSSESFELY
jgi:hypothetical protein